MAINEQKLTPEEVNALPISGLLPKLFETGRSAAPDAISKKWYEGVVKIIGERFLDERTNSLRTLFEKALEPIANSNSFNDNNIKQAVDLFCEIPTNKVIKTCPELIDQVLDSFRGRLCIKLRTRKSNNIQRYFEKHKDLPKFSQKSNGLNINSNLDKELNDLADKCETSLYNGNTCDAFEPVLSIILGVGE